MPTRQDYVSVYFAAVPERALNFLKT